ncbi:MAG TPA: hypothetical protein VKU19_19190 [Bryobacteraceae bacterium]|nr:hypothetical protein [Bryobacteraceae bacterium]
MTLAPTSVPEPVTQCPYPGCGRTLPNLTSGFCACEFREPVAVCRSCGVVCPADARFCRGCRTPLPPPETPDIRKLSSTPSPQVLFVPGVFHAPPIAHGRHLWCLAAGGQLSRLSLGPGAKPRDWALITSPSAGFNRFAIVDAVIGNRAARRPMLLALDSEGIWSLPLVQHEASILYCPPAGHEIVANLSAAESIFFRGLAATPDAYAFLMRVPTAREAVLAIRYFDDDRAGSQPFQIAGTSFLGPVMENGLVTVCGEEEVFVYRINEQERESFELRNFTPLFSRSSAELKMPLGVVPLWAGFGDRGLEARIAGTRDGQTGWLRVFFERHYDEFTPLPSQASIARAEPSGLCVNLLETIEFLGVDQPSRHYGTLEPGMPVGCSGPNMAYFNRADSPMRHQLTVFAGLPIGLDFEDRDCHPNSCCGLSFDGPSLVVSYIVPSKPKSERGLRFTHWRLRN